mmetsp:Transcript_13194/g.23655  ORF Transcript_13194/g.23655 Transcript_13194/m.23655 type:complete len:268 (-) Transcript_13194:1422-2225(-)
MHRVKGSDNVVPDYITRLPTHLLPSPSFASKLDRIEELATMDACAVAYMSSILSTMQLRDRSLIRPPPRLMQANLPKPTPYSTHDSRDIAAGELYKHPDGDHPYDLALPPQQPLPRSLPLTEEFTLSYATCDEFRKVWESVQTDHVAYPFHRIGAMELYFASQPTSDILSCNTATSQRGTKVFGPYLGRFEPSSFGERWFRTSRIGFVHNVRGVSSLKLPGESLPVACTPFPSRGRSLPKYHVTSPPFPLPTEWIKCSWSWIGLLGI